MTCPACPWLLSKFFPSPPTVEKPSRRLLPDRKRWRSFGYSGHQVQVTFKSTMSAWPTKRAPPRRCWRHATAGFETTLEMDLDMPKSTLWTLDVDWPWGVVRLISLMRRMKSYFPIFFLSVVLSFHLSSFFCFFSSFLSFFLIVWPLVCTYFKVTCWFWHANTFIVKNLTLCLEVMIDQNGVHNSGTTSWGTVDSVSPSLLGRTTNIMISSVGSWGTLYISANLLKYKKRLNLNPLYILHIADYVDLVKYPSLEIN